MLRDLKSRNNSMNYKFPIQTKMKISEKQLLNKLGTINAELTLNDQDFLVKNIKNSNSSIKENILDNRVNKNEEINDISIKNSY